MSIRVLRLIPTFFIPLLIGCAGVQSAPESAASPPSAEAAPSGEASVAEARPWPLAIVWARTSAESRAIYRQTYRAATDIVEQAAVGRAPGTWAVSVDADETVIDNSQYNIEMWERRLNHSAERFFEWARRVEAPPVPGALPFLERVHELGGKIVVVTNRRMPICDVTRENFVKYEIPFDLILCRPTETERDKTPRYEAVQAGTASPDLPPLEIVLWVGDAIGDFPNGSQEWRQEADDPFADFGDRYLLLPNPVYGNWMSNREE